MCFGPSAAEKAAAQDQRVAAEEAKRLEIEKRARSKRNDIMEELSNRGLGVASDRKFGGGKGRRSLFSAGSAGFLSRFE